jgi:hypothetical protein
MAFQSVCINSHTHQQCITIPVILYPVICTVTVFNLSNSGSDILVFFNLNLYFSGG